MKAKSRKSTPYEYVRSVYGKPAYEGVSVTANWGEKKHGVIAKDRGDQYVHVVFDGAKFAVPVHPDELEYAP